MGFYLSVTARRAFCRRSVWDAVTRRSVKTEQLSADTIVFLLLGENEYQGVTTIYYGNRSCDDRINSQSRQMCLDPFDTGHQGWAVFQARHGEVQRPHEGCWTGRWPSLHCHCEKKNRELIRLSHLSGTGRWPTIIGLWRQRALLEEMVKLSNAARGPLETAVSMSQVTHDVTVFPATALSAGSPQVTRRRWTVVNRAQSKTQKNCVIASSFQDTSTVLTNGRLREQRRWCQRIHRCPQRWLHCWLSRDAC